MNYHRFKQKVIVPLIVVPAMLTLGAGFASAQDTVVDTSLITEATQAAERSFSAAAESQVTINRLSDEADTLFDEFVTVGKLVDGLEIYNAGFRRTISQQLETIATYDQSIDDAAGLQRQIAPLMERMMVALEQFVALDLPFQVEERQARLNLIRTTFDDATVNVAEKFRLVLVAYQTENGYGRGMDSYSDVLEIDGIERDVDILRVGRVTMLYQTSDQTSTGVWDKTNGSWVTLGSEYRRPVRDGIRMANQLASTEILELPIPAPE